MLRQGDFLQNGRYRIEEDRPIGKGGQGSVYKAIDFNLSIIVAIKETQMRSPALSQAFKREAQKLATLSHSGLPTCSNHFEENQNQYLVMAYIGGADFAQLLKQQRKPFSMLDVLNWADSLLDVVIYLHSLKNPLIHRDIKPANLKLDAHGRVVLLDLGIATGGLTQMTIIPSRGYTRGYAPLEQEMGGDTDERTDIYAIGATLYHFLTNVRPLAATDREKRIVDPLQRADELNSQVPHELADLLVDAMTIYPGERIPNAKILRHKLAQIRMSIVTPYEPDKLDQLDQTEPRELQESQKPREPQESGESRELPWNLVRLLLGSAVAVLFVILFVGMLRTMIAGESSPRDVQATTPANESVVVVPTNVAASATQLITQNPEPIATQTALPAITLTLEVVQATQEPLATQKPVATQKAIATITLMPTVAVKVTQPPDSANPPVALPPALVGTPIARPVTAISVDTIQQVAQLARLGKGQVKEIAYSPNGALLVAASNLGIYIYDAQTLAQIRLIETTHVLSSATFSPDGQFIAGGGLFDPTVRVWRVSDGVLITELVGHRKMMLIACFFRLTGKFWPLEEMMARYAYGTYQMARYGIH